MEEKNDTIPAKALKLFGILTGIFIGLSAIFKMMQWPGASIMHLLGCVLFIFFYLPLWFIQTFDKKSKWSKIYHFLILLLTSLTYLVKTMHWPFGGVLFNVWVGVAIYIVFPVSIYQLFSVSSRSTLQLHTAIVLILLGALVISGIGGSYSRIIHMAESFSKTANSIVISTGRLETKNEQIYKAFELLPGKEGMDNYSKAQRLKRMSDSVTNYLRNLKKKVVATNESISEAQADTISQQDMRNLLTYETITSMLWGDDDYTPKEGPYSGMELMLLLESYRDSIIQLATKENRDLIRNAINLDTKPTVDEDGESLHWVAATFRFVNIPTFLFTMTNLKYEVRNAESQVLSDLYASTDKRSQKDLDLKVAELGAKLESSKKENEIKELQRIQELAQKSMEEKNRSIDATNQVLVSFIIAFVLFIVLIFFVIRSNILRKEANKELASQKHLIEEKNKEILDSINYAQRIQRAHMPTEKFVSRVLSQLKKDR